MIIIGTSSFLSSTLSPNSFVSKQSCLAETILAESFMKIEHDFWRGFLWIMLKCFRFNGRTRVKRSFDLRTTILRTIEFFMVALKKLNRLFARSAQRYACCRPSVTLLALKNGLIRAITNFLVPILILQRNGDCQESKGPRVYTTLWPHPLCRLHLLNLLWLLEVPLDSAPFATLPNRCWIWFAGIGVRSAVRVPLPC